MTDLPTLLAPVLAEQERTGVRVLPEWFRFYYAVRCTHIVDPPPADAAALIAVGAMVTWLGGGIDNCDREEVLSECIAAVLDALQHAPDAKGAARD